jgi:hypothetical protein
MDRAHFMQNAIDPTFAKPNDGGFALCRWIDRSIVEVYDSADYRIVERPPVRSVKFPEIAIGEYDLAASRSESGWARVPIRSSTGITRLNTKTASRR